MYLSSVIKLVGEASSVAGFVLVILLPMMYVARTWSPKTKPKKIKTEVVEKHYIDTKLQEQLSDLETRVNQKLVQTIDTTKQSRIEDLHERMEALEDQFDQETFVHKLILDNKSLLLEIALQSEKTRGLRNRQVVDQTHQMESLSAAVQNIADTTKTFNDLLPRVVALEASQLTAQEENAPTQQTQDLSQKVQKLNGDQFELKTLIKHNRKALETKLNGMEADFRGHLSEHDNTLKDIYKRADVEFISLREILAQFDYSVRNLNARLEQIELMIYQAAGAYHYEEDVTAAPNQIILR